MKITYYVNLFAIGLPIILGLLGFIDKDFFLQALISTILTGCIQIIIGFSMFIQNPKNKYILIYLLGVILYFAVIIFNINSFNTTIVDIIKFGLPPILAIYLTIIIYKTKG